MFGGKLGLPELLVIVAIALLIFGPKKLGELGKGLGEGIRNFKSSMSEHNAATTTPPSNPTPTPTPTPTEDKKS
jgi:sec-independent protein translocase protein TatA